MPGGKNALKPNPLRMLWEYINYIYFQYCIHLGLNGLEVWEVRFINTVLVLILATSIYTTYLFLPGHLLMWVRVFRSCTAALNSALGLSADDDDFAQQQQQQLSNSDSLPTEL